MQNRILHLIEPTLFDQTGHGFGYVQSLLQANKEFAYDMHLWIDKRGSNLFAKEFGTTHTYFSRAQRQVQKVFLYLKLIKQPGTIFVSTSDLWDLKILAFYSKLMNSNKSIFLHFHQFKQTDKKLATLRKIATKNQNITILTPTEKLAQIFSSNGFKNCIVVPCPTLAPVRDLTQSTEQFNKILYAGAARNDKGFPLVVELLQYLRSKHIVLPFEIQVSAPNSCRYDNTSWDALQRLQQINQVNLKLHKDTLDQTQYLALFNNAICLLLYDQRSYQDKFSGIALDAFYAGCPILTVRNTWMGDMAEKYQAGIALDDLSLFSIRKAIDRIVANYAFYHTNAKHAAVELHKLHDPRNTLTVIQAMAPTARQAQAV